MTETWQNRLGVSGEDWAKGFAAAQFTLPLDYLYINRAGAYRERRRPPGDAAGDRPGLHRRSTCSTPTASTARCCSPGSCWASARCPTRHGRGHDRLGLQRVDVRALAAERRALARRARASPRRTRRPRSRRSTASPSAPGSSPSSCRWAQILMGERHYYPIYEACAAPRAAAHACTRRAPRTSSRRRRGWPARPTFYLEWHTALGQIHQSNTLSMICHGVFERSPKLKYVIAEGGFVWAAGDHVEARPRLEGPAQRGAVAGQAAERVPARPHPLHHAAVHRAARAARTSGRCSRCCTPTAR